MSTFFTILILFFIVTAIWQIVKIYDLTQVNTVAKDSSQIANDKDNKVNGYLMLGFLIFIYVIIIICFIRYGDFPLMSNSASVLPRLTSTWPSTTPLRWHAKANAAMDGKLAWAPNRGA